METRLKKTISSTESKFHPVTELVPCQLHDDLLDDLDWVEVNTTPLATVQEQQDEPEWDFVDILPEEKPHAVVQPQPKSLADFVMSPVAAAVKSITAHPILALFNFAGSIQITLYSLTVFSNTQPSDIGAAWWSEMSPAIKFLSGLNALSTFFINVLINDKYLPYSLEKLKKNLKKYFSSVADFVENNLFILTGLYSALVAGALSFGAISWAGEIASICLSLANLLAYGSRRYVGIVDLTSKFINLFDDDVKFQKLCVEHLSQFKPEYHAEFNRALQNQDLNADTVAEVLNTLYDTAALLDSKQSLFLNSDINKSYLRNALLVSGSAILSILTLPTSMQLGYEGAGILSSLVFNYDIGTLTNASKIAIGFIPGLTSGAFIFISGLDCERSFKEIYATMKNDYSTIPRNLTTMLMTGLAASAFLSVADGITNDQNIFGLNAQNKFTPVFSYGNFLTSFIIGINNVDKFLINDKPGPKTVPDVIKWLQKNELPKEKIAALRKHAFFKAKHPQIELAPIKVAAPAP